MRYRSVFIKDTYICKGGKEHTLIMRVFVSFFSLCCANERDCSLLLILGSHSVLMILTPLTTTPSGLIQHCNYQRCCCWIQVLLP